MHTPDAASPLPSTPSVARNRWGWGLTGFVGAFMLLASAPGKFIQPRPDMIVKGAEELGVNLEHYTALGMLEVTVVVLALIPRTSFVGTILLTGYLGGACAIHARVGQLAGLLPVFLGVLAWAGLALRRPALVRAAFPRD
jgi:hypothetical protein